MMKRAILWLGILVSTSPLAAFGADITNIEARLVNEDIMVSAGMSLDEKNLEDIKKGISREITFYIDLFRSWQTWPDEFVTGKKFTHILKSDQIKNEYIATSSDGSTVTKKRFKDFDSMLHWVMYIQNLKLIGTKELEPADYFVRITAESRIRTLPPVIGYILFFVPEREFKVTRDSRVFTIGRPR